MVRTAVAEGEHSAGTAAPDAPVVLTASGLVKDYGTGPAVRRVLAGVDLEVRRGQFVAVVAPSGSGKSTLLHLLGGLDVPTAGHVTVEDRRLDELSEPERTELRRHRLGFVFQQYNLVPVLTAEENVALPLVISRCPAERRRERVATLLDLMDLRARAGELPGRLSGGEQQRVAVARALVTEPAVVLADEPTGALDSETGRQILLLLRKAQHDFGQTIVMVTHDPAAAALADEVLRLRDGQIVERYHIGRRGNAAQRVARLLAGDSTETE
jgi:putative ABC transport system ATP-binding protein